MAEATPTQLTSTEPQGLRRSSPFVLSGLTSGHGVFHWFTQSLNTMLPEIQQFFGLSAVQVGYIATTRELASGIVSLPGGVVTDLVRRHWGLVLACCMALFGLGWMLMGFSPVYPLLLAGMVLVAVSASVWHMPATAALSRHFAQRRGSALAIHGVGGNIGDVAAPLVTGILLAFLTWQGILKIYAVIPLFLAFLVFWSFRDIGRFSNTNPGAADTRPDLESQIAQTKALLRNPRLWAITLAAGVRGMAFVSFVTFLPLYLNDVLELSVASRGLHLSLLVLVGILFTPMMGYVSDRIGRKWVLIPGMVWLTVLTVLLVPYGHGFAIIILLAGLGVFLYSDQPILTAAALDAAGGDVAATTLGVMSFSRFLLSAAAPPIGGIFYEINPDQVFIYIAVLFAIAIAILVFTPMPRQE